MHSLMGTKKMSSILTSFRKAFDKVNHKTLEKILVFSWFGEPLLFWFSFYLKNRTQCIKVFGIKSAKSAKFRLGTPFPNLFLSFHKIASWVLFTIVKNSQFADDLKYFLEIGCYDNCLLLHIWTLMR